MFKKQDFIWNKFALFFQVFLFCLIWFLLQEVLKVFDFDFCTFRKISFTIFLWTEKWSYECTYLILILWFYFIQISNTLQCWTISSVLFMFHVKLLAVIIVAWSKSLKQLMGHLYFDLSGVTKRPSLLIGSILQNT